ncbi:MAG: hypothetical protein ACRD12_02870, partial [Acidimicrobiales bacterium]
VRGRVAARPPDPLARAFEEAASSTGIVTAAAAVPAYVGQMRRFWATRTAVEPRPTSAHILARHGRLAMVRVPRMSVHTGGRAPDADLAAMTAARFRASVGTAYRDGRARLATLARAGGGGGHG